MKTIEMPKMGDTMEEGKILRWLKKEGDPVKKGEFVAEVETEKVNIEIEAFSSGVLRKILIPEGKSAPVGASIALVGVADEPLPAGMNDPATANVISAPKSGAANTLTSVAPSTSGISQTSVVSTTTATRQGRIFISPIARRLAQEHNLDYHSIQGTGPNGRIIRMDIESALATQKQAAPAAPAPTSIEPAPGPVAAITADTEVEIPLTSMRRAIARRLSQSMQTAPHFYMTSVIDTGKLAALRQQINEYAAKDPAPVKVSFNDLIIKAVARALLRIPQMNVSFAEDRILQKKQVHIGVAVALEQGLIVPVVRHADQRGILEIARETQRLAEAARTGKLRPEELSGGTFTVSNLGMFDVESFTAIINPPESAILAIGAITPTPAVVDGQIVVRDRMKVTLSSDHRAIDGAIAARFLQEVKRLLEEPLGLLI
jgi:pyruvate dehydrogenase E2 component (dihydrolipoamide acetyltransferase)